MFRVRRFAVLVLISAVSVLCTASQSPGRTATGPTAPNPQQSLSDSTATPIDVSGRVVNGRNNQPISRVLVQFGSRRVLTDRDGIFRFPMVTATSATFRASKPGFFPASDDASHLYTLPGDTAIELTLYPEAILSGTVIDTAGDPVPRLSVSARASTYNDTGHHWRQTGYAQTLSDGTFRLSLPAGRYALQLSPTSRVAAGVDFLQPLSVPANLTNVAEAIRLAPGDQLHLDLRPSIRRAYDVALRVQRGTQGQDRGFPMLTARPIGGPAIRLPVIPNRDDPDSVHVALPNGTYEIIADLFNQDSRRQGRTRVTVAGHDVSGVQLSLTPVPVFPVLIEVDSSATSDPTTNIPIAQQLGISLNPEPTSVDLNDQSFSISSRGSAPPSISLPEGSYSFRSRNGGPWYVTAASCGGTDLLRQNLSIVPGAAGAELRVRISNRTADLSGSILLANAPAPAWVYLIATTPSASPIVAFRSSTTGAFSRPYLAPGSYRAIAFEHQPAVDLQDQTVLNRFLSRVQTITINPGDHATLTLNAVPAAELIP